MNVYPQTATYRTMILCFGMLIVLTPCPMPRKTVNPIILSDTLAQTFNNRSSALTGAAITVLALAEPFIAAGAAVAFIRCCLLFFKGAHGLVVPPRHGSFLPVRTDSSGRATEKGKAPAAMSGMKL